MHPVPPVAVHEQPPMGARTIPRPRLTAELDRILEVGVGLVSAAAGAGKTTLLSSWATELDDSNVVWVTCRAEHNDPMVLAQQIRTALAPVVELPANAPLGGVLGALACEPMSGPAIVLILDDAHTIHSRPVLSAIERLIESRPPNLSLVISGRDDPGIPWHKIRLRGIVELRGPDLAFEHSEARKLLAHTFGRVLHDDLLSAVCRLTEGWAAGLCLAGLTMRSSPDQRSIDGRQVVQHRFVRDYFDMEVLASLPDDEVGFLKATSVLEWLDPELCDVLTGRSDSEDLLERFVDMNLFTVRVPGSPVRFKYHALFAEFLRGRLSGSQHLDRQALLRTASEWYEHRGEMDAAIMAALDAEDYERAERLIGAACGPAVRLGMAATVVRWVSGLPAETIERSPELSFVLARAAAARGDLHIARSAREDARRHYQRSPEERWLRFGIVQLDFLLHVLEGALGGVVEEIEEAIQIHAANADQAALAMFGIDEEALVVYRGLALLLTGRLDAAISDTDLALTPARLAHPTRATVLGVGIRSLALAWAGEEAEAARCLDTGRNVVLQFGGSTGDPLPFHAAEAWISEGAAADRSLSAARFIVEELGFPLYRLVFTLTEAQQALRGGRWSDASASLAEADGLIATMQDAGFLGQLAVDMRSKLAAVHPSVTSETLNPREVEILSEIAAGSSRREAARDLHLSVNTVKTYLRTAYRKLGATDRVEAVRRARQLGVIAGADIVSDAPGFPERKLP